MSTVLGSAALSQTNASSGFSHTSLRQRLQAFICAQIDRPVRVELLVRLTSGFSWITYSFSLATEDGLTDFAGDFILRVGDQNGHMAPYQAAPEFAFVTALADAPEIPLARAYWHSDDDAILGAPFIILQRVEGTTPIPWRSTTDREGTRDFGPAVADQFACALAAIHSFDWQATPIAAWSGEIDRRTAARRQVSHWAGRMGGAGFPRHAAMHYAAQWLTSHAPMAPRVSVIHGDYRIGNYLQKDGCITAILDWELVHLGDPHEDIAWLGLRTFGGTKTHIGGVFDRDDFYRVYQARSGLRIEADLIRYYEILSLFKLAVMALGAIRQVDGETVQDLRLASIGLQLTPTLTSLLSRIRDAS